MLHIEYILTYISFDVVHDQYKLSQNLIHSTSFKNFRSAPIIIIVGIIIISVILVIIFYHNISLFTEYLISILLEQYNFNLNHKNGVQVFATNISNGSLTIVTISSNGSLLGGATYSITPSNHNNSLGKYIVKDDDVHDRNKTKAGIITITGMQNENYTITEETPPQGYLTDKLSKIVEITTEQPVATVTLVNTLSNPVEQNSNNPQTKDITYTAKFECGTIFGDEGPLRPGHYDTDISIFNRQQFPVTIIWNTIINNGKSTTAIVKTIQSQTSTSIVCNDLRQLFNIGNNTGKLVEGFVIIQIQMSNGILGSLADNGGGMVIVNPLSQNENNFLDVQVFYTANALSTLPHEVLIDKITFSILNDTSRKIPSSMLMKTLDIAIKSNMNEISDPISVVKNALVKTYNLSEADINKIIIKIMNISLGVSSMIDDHAISSYPIRPQISN